MIILAVAASYLFMFPNGKNFYLTPINKVIDPEHEQFDVMQFRFEDYLRSDGINSVKFGYCKIVKNAFKLGTPLQTVVEIMESAKAPLIKQTTNEIVFVNPLRVYGLHKHINNYFAALYGAEQYIFAHDEQYKITEIKCKIDAFGITGAMLLGNVNRSIDKPK